MTMYEAGRQLRLQLLNLYDAQEAANIAALVMEHLNGGNQVDRALNNTALLSAAQQQMLDTTTLALLAHRPLQYVLQQAWFYGISLYVDERVLIPRPETEELVDWLIRDLRENGSLPKRILDIGTGSGCIPLAIKKNLPGTDMHSCDVSEEALAVAQKNAMTQQLNIHFHLLNILASGDYTGPAFDILISNPPYVPEKDKEQMAAHVLLYEPALALFVKDNDPLLFYEAIADFAKKNLVPQGSIYLEVHEELAGAVAECYRQKGFTPVQIKNDLQGKPRMVKIAGI